MNHFSIQVADWQQNQTKLKAVRHTVFVVEQNVPEELEWDDKDTNAFHFLAYNNDDEAVGAVRLLKTGQIGRMAVLENYREKGMGHALMKAALSLAKKNKYSSVFLHAQTSAVTFYEAFGFTATGEEYKEAGIPHRSMKKILID